MLNQFSSSVTIFALVLMVLVLGGAAMEGARIAIAAAFSLLRVAARAASAVLVVVVVAILLAAVLFG